MLPEHQDAEGAVQGGQGPEHHPDGVEFDATIVMHLVYGNSVSANVAGHKQNGYATAKCKHPVWFKSKDAFMGFVCKAFEQFYDEMKADGSRSESDSASGQAAGSLPRDG